MELIRCSDQGGSLEEFYTELSEKRGSLGEGAKATLSLIARLRSWADGRKVFGLTSHARLCLLAADSFRSPWLVVVSAIDRNNYFIEYRMPAAVAPWSNAYVRGEARTEDEAVDMIRTAMEKSEGWRLP